MATNQNIQEVVQRSLEVALREAKERIIKKYEVQMMDDFREEMAKIVLRTENFYRVEVRREDVIITLVNKVGSE